jgi:hypothetical protein
MCLFWRGVQDSFSDFALAVAARDNGRTFRISKPWKSSDESSSDAIKAVMRYFVEP